MGESVSVGGRVCDLVPATAGAAALAEMLVDRTELALTRFANSLIHQNVATPPTSGCGLHHDRPNGDRIHYRL